MSKITFAIEYAGLNLQITKNEQGEDVTPLKPIADLFGLQWKVQRKKVTESEFYRRHLGVSDTPRRTSNPTYANEIFIRFDRVAAYLMTINPDQVRSQGNESSADFLENKIKEWSDALHDYEEMGVAINMNHARAQDALRKQRDSFSRMMVVKNKLADAADQRAVGYVAQQMAAELGVPYQLDLEAK